MWVYHRRPQTTETEGRQCRVGWGGKRIYPGSSLFRLIKFDRKQKFGIPSYFVCLISLTWYFFWCHGNKNAQIRHHVQDCSFILATKSKAKWNNQEELDFTKWNYKLHFQVHRTTSATWIIKPYSFCKFIFYFFSVAINYSALQANYRHSSSAEYWSHWHKQSWVGKFYLFITLYVNVLYSTKEIIIILWHIVICSQGLASLSQIIILVEIPVEINLCCLLIGESGRCRWSNILCSGSNSCG